MDWYEVSGIVERPHLGPVGFIFSMQNIFPFESKPIQAESSEEAIEKVLHVLSEEYIRDSNAVESAQASEEEERGIEKFMQSLRPVRLQDWKAMIISEREAREKIASIETA